MAKKKKSAHLRFGESIADYSKKCGVVRSRLLVVPSGLDGADVPFKFTRRGLRADYHTSACPDWRKEQLKRKNSVVLAVWHNDGIALRDAKKEVGAYKGECLRLYHEQLRTPTDPWALVNPEEVRAWLALVEEVGVDAVEGANVYAGAYAVYGEDFSRMTDDERQRLADARDALRMQRVKDAEVKHHQKRKVNQFISVSGDLFGQPISETGQACLIEYAVRIANGALSKTYASSGSVFLLSIKAQYTQVRRRMDAQDWATGAVVGGPFLLTAGKGKDVEEGKGGRRYKVDFKLSEIKGKIMYKEKKYKNSFGALKSAGHYALTKEAEEEVKLATDAVVSSTLTDFDAVVNSVFCPADGDITLSFLYRVLLGCVSLDEVWSIYRKYGYSGAMRQIDLMRSDYSNTKSQYISVVSLADLAHDIQGQKDIPEDYFDELVYIWDEIKECFPSCRGCRSDKYKQVFFRMCSDLTTEEISHLTDIPVRTVRYYSNKIRSAVADFVKAKQARRLA